MDAPIILKGIPIPPRTNGRGQRSPITDTLAIMEIGDCIDIPHRKTNLYAKAKTAGIRFSVRTIKGDDGQKRWRVWRIG